MNTPERIYLQPECCADPATGRVWCEDAGPVDCDEGVPWTEYVRADVIPDRLRALSERISILRDALDDIASMQHSDSCRWVTDDVDCTCHVRTARRALGGPE